jgi:fimbrial chaperone protein
VVAIPTSRAVVCLAAALALTRTVIAGTFSVDPVRVSLAAGHPIDSVKIRNGSSEPVVVQLEVSSWSQHEGEARLAPTTDLLATPPIFRIPGGGTQLVRVGLRRAPDPQQELSYRLFLREVPSATASASSIRITLSISLPVFVAPLAKIAPIVKWRALTAPNGLVRIEATNIGNAHVHVAQLELSQAETGRKLAVQAVSGYVLAADNRSWTLTPDPLPSPGGLLHVLARTEAGELQADVPLEGAVSMSALGPQATPSR